LEGERADVRDMMPITSTIWKVDMDFQKDSHLLKMMKVARDIPNGEELLESLKPLSEVFGTHGGPAVDLLPVIIQVPETLHAAVVD
jgi:hypothetical protein